MLVAALVAVGITAAPAASAPALVGGQRPVQLRALMRRLMKYSAQARSRQAVAKAGVGQVCCRWKINGQEFFEFKQEDCFVAGSTEFAMIPVNGGCSADGFTAFFPPNCHQPRALWEVYSDMLGTTTNDKGHMESTAKAVVGRLCPGKKVVEGPKLPELKRQLAAAEKDLRDMSQQVKAAEKMVTEQSSRFSEAMKALKEAEENKVQRLKAYGDATRAQSALGRRIAELERQMG